MLKVITKIEDLYLNSKLMTPKSEIHVSLFEIDGVFTSSRAEILYNHFVMGGGEGIKMRVYYLTSKLC